MRTHLTTLLTLLLVSVPLGTQPVAQELEWLGDLDLTGLLGLSLAEAHSECPTDWEQWPDGSASCDGFNGEGQSVFARVQQGGIDLAAVIINVGMTNPTSLYEEFEGQFSQRCQPIPSSIPFVSVWECGEYEAQLSAVDMRSVGFGSSIVSIDVWYASSTDPGNPPPILE